jgi:hypothetical protein
MGKGRKIKMRRINDTFTAFYAEYILSCGE